MVSLRQCYKVNTYFGVPWPSLRVFLGWIQKCEYVEYSLPLAGHSITYTYVHLDNENWSAGVKYGVEIGFILYRATRASSLAEDVAMSQFRCARVKNVRHSTYLLRCNDYT